MHGYLFHKRESTRILQPRPVLTLRTKDDGTQEAKCRCTLQGVKDPDVLEPVRERKTESPTLSVNGRALIFPFIASCRFVLTVGDVQADFLLAVKEDMAWEISPSSGGKLLRNSSLSSLVLINILWMCVCSD